MPLDLEIGGYHIRLRENAQRPLIFWPAQAFHQFEVPAQANADLTFDVVVCDELPPVSYGKPLHDAGAGLWKLYAQDDGYLLESVDPQTSRPLNRARLSADYSRGTIWTAQGAAWSPSRVLNPVVEACLLTRLARDGGLMLHAAGVDFRGDGLIFTGPSGAGKSTLSGLFIDRGALILNDERVIVRDAAASPVVHGTPWCGSNPVVHHARAPLRALYFIRHGEGAHRLSPLRPAQAVSLCVKQAFLPYWDAAAMERTLASAEKLVGGIEALEYAFLNQPSAVDRLLEREPVA